MNNELTSPFFQNIIYENNSQNTNSDELSEYNGFEKNSPIFRYCEFNNITVCGKCFDATFISCKINFLDSYWNLFNACLFVDTIFSSCKFFGDSFMMCKFINCSFINCIFGNDAYDKPCSFEDTQWINIKNENCVGMSNFK
jgi:hypothetical protein